MPYDKRDDETGEYSPSYADTAFLDALRALDGQATTQDVRERVGCAYRTAHSRLSKLESEGEIESRDVGAAKLWMLGGGSDE